MDLREGGQELFRLCEMDSGGGARTSAGSTKLACRGPGTIVSKARLTGRGPGITAGRTKQTWRGGSSN